MIATGDSFLCHYSFRAYLHRRRCCWITDHAAKPPQCLLPPLCQASLSKYGPLLISKYLLHIRTARTSYIACSRYSAAGFMICMCDCRSDVTVQLVSLRARRALGAPARAGAGDAGHMPRGTSWKWTRNVRAHCHIARAGGKFFTDRLCLRRLARQTRARETSVLALRSASALAT